jgi:hypothetical protein
MISNLLLKHRKLTKDEYLIIQDVFSKEEKELLEEIVECQENSDKEVKE